jgi:arsenite methyltransferase
MLRRSCPVNAPSKPPWPAPLWRHLSGQAARPRGPIGCLLSRIWIRETAAVNDTAVALLGAVVAARVLELGFGPGRTLGRLAAAGAEVIGVETSPTMLAAARRRNSHHIAAGRMRLYQGDGITLPVDDHSVNAAISVHTLYFWLRPTETINEIARVLHHGGRLVLAFHAGEHPLPRRLDPAVYRVPTTTQVTQWLHTAGFTDVRTESRTTEPTVAWLIATKG